MDIAIPKSEVHFYNRISALSEEYIQAKEALLLAEQYEPNSEFYIAPLNELRSALDHIMRAVAFPGELDYQMKEASSHIKRAAYDAFEILNMNLTNFQEIEVSKFNSSVISHVFPEYYLECIPLINKVKYETARIRAHKKVISEINSTHYEEYFNISVQLIKQNELLVSKMSALEDYSQRSRKKRTKSLIWYWIATVILATISFLIGNSI